jgi:hypothetical protein
MSPDERWLFAIAERLHMSVVAVERMSMREVMGWIDYFHDQAEAQRPPDDAVDMSKLSKTQLRAMFHP